MRIVLETEDGEILRSVFDRYNRLLDLASRSDIDRTHIDCKRLVDFIDEYGDTICNRLQIAQLEDELAALGEYAKSDEEQKLLTQLHALVAESKRHVHIYIRFRGD